MSAPKTNIERQQKRHRPALLGIGAAVGFASLLLVFLLFYLFYWGNDPGETSGPVDSGQQITEPVEETEPIADPFEEPNERQ